MTISRLRSQARNRYLGHWRRLPEQAGGQLFPRDHVLLPMVRRRVSGEDGPVNFLTAEDVMRGQLLERGFSDDQQFRAQALVT